MTTELRCHSRLHGKVSSEPPTLEVKCNSKHCGAGSGVIVLHFFNVSTGELVETQKFRSPEELFKKTGG